MGSRVNAIAGVVFLVASGVYLFLAARLPIGTVAQPGAGVFPRVVGVLLVVTSVMLVAQALRHREPGARLPADAWRRVSGVAAALAVFCLALPWLGYPVPAFGLLLAVLRMFGVTRWRAAVLVALLAAAISYYVFVFVLDVPLPAGPLGR